MNPIPTTNAMKPAPGKGVSSFPTPVIKDTVIVEVVNAWKGDYQPLEYGTKWDDVPHASVQGSFPDHKLINQAPNSEDGQWVKRIWANDRVDQDTYNYAIKYSGGSDAHPIYIRTYVELRETYAPVPDLSPDPLFPNALLVEEEVQRQDNELDSRYVKVIRTYETLPGPIISSQRVNERGDLETVEVQEVAPNTPPDPDGLFVTQTQVLKEDVSKGTKTTATVPSYTQLLVKEKKEGLLGETVTTDDIVDPATQPDALSQSVVASVVQQTSATKAVKRTTTASGPVSLSKKSNDGKLLGDVTATQSVVPPDASPDTLSSTILSSEVSQVDSGRAIKTNVALNSTPTLQGQDKKPGLLGTTTATESVVPAGTSADALSQTIVSSTVEPIDSVRSRKVTVESSGPTQLTGKRINQRGDIETIEESIVPAGTNAGPDGLLVISSEVEPIDSAKSKITTATVPSHSALIGSEKKSGLLANTTVIDRIVDPTENADNITFDGSGGVLESSVSPISKTKSKKTTVTSTGPVSLATNTLVDSPIGLVKATVEKSIVDPTVQPQNGPLVIRDSINKTDEVKSERERVTVVQEWPKVYGTWIDSANGIVLPYYETIVNSASVSWNAPLSDYLEYEPVDETKTKVRVFDGGVVNDILTRSWAVSRQYQEVQVRLPNKLLEVTAYFGLDNGKGESEGEGAGAGDSYNYNFTKSHTTSASATGDIYFKIQKGYEGIVNGYKYTFYTSGNTDRNRVISFLNQGFGAKIENYPEFQMTSENLVIIGGSKSESKSESESESVSLNGSSTSNSKSTSYNVSVSANSVVVPESLHAQLPVTISPTGDLGELTINYQVYPPTLQATEPAKFPTGEFLMSINVERYKFNFFKCTCITAIIEAKHV